MYPIKDPTTLAIRAAFKALLEALSEGRKADAAGYLAEDLYANISLWGETRTAEDFLSEMDLGELAVSQQKVMATNVAVRYRGDQAQQSAIVMVLLGVGPGPADFHMVMLGGRLTASWVRDGEQWKIAELRYDHEFQTGNTAFVAAWSLMDYQVYGGHRLAIAAELDSPWVRFPDPDNDFTEEERLVDGYLRYTWGLDTTDIPMVLSAVTHDISASMPHGEFTSNRDFAYYMRFLGHKEAKMQHAGRIASWEFTGKDTAKLFIHRIEPHRMGTKALHAGNFRDTWYSGIHDFDMRKVAGEWQIAKMVFTGKVWLNNDDHSSVLLDECAVLR